MPDEHDQLDAEPREEERQQQHEDDLAHLAERLDERRLGRADLVQEGVRERVVELERHAEQERSDDEHREVRSRSRCSASSPSASRTENGAPAAFGGVCGSASEKTPITADAPAASCIGDVERVGPAAPCRR